MSNWNPLFTRANITPYNYFKLRIVQILIVSSLSSFWILVLLLKGEMHNYSINFSELRQVSLMKVRMK